MAIEAKVLSLPDPDGAIKRIIPRPEDIFTPDEAALIQRAGRGELPCLACGQPMAAAKIMSDVYEGVTLFCPDGGCGYVEF